MKNKFFLVIILITVVCLVVVSGVYSGNNMNNNGSSVINGIGEIKGITVESRSDDFRLVDNSIDFGLPFFLNFTIDIVTVLIIVLFIYFPSNRKLDYIFTFVLFNIVIFLLTYVLNEVKISMGAALGLFAIFSMLRYRTDSISMKEMTYLFTFIAIGLISATQLEYYQLLIINGIIIISILILDSKLIFKKESSRLIIYDNNELLQPRKRSELIEDLNMRTGLNVHRVSIERVDMKKNSAEIIIYFYDIKNT